MTPAATGGSFRDTMLAAGLLTVTGVDGVYGRSGVYEDVAAALEGLAARHADPGAVRVYFPPVMPRSVFEKTGYLASFPNLMGSVYSFTGDDHDHVEMLDLARAGEDWTSHLVPTEVMLCSAACHPVYPTVQGPLPTHGLSFIVTCWCFRHEPSLQVTRAQAFRQFEYVNISDEAETVARRDQWVGRVHALLVDMGLPVTVEVANDPFFGRGGRMLARNQMDERLKLEFVVPFDDDAPTVAIASSNLHQDHFGQVFGITDSSGSAAHSTCLGYGIDRIVLALFRHLGLDPRQWPARTRELLWP